MPDIGIPPNDGLGMLDGYKKPIRSKDWILHQENSYVANSHGW